MLHKAEQFRIDSSIYRRLALALFAGLLLATAATPPRAAQAQTGANAQPPAPRPRTKRVTPLRKSDSAQGSRVTITSDGGALSDYSAYRSGDRFIVVIPQAEAVGGGGGVSGRGLAGAQVSKRGNDLVYTFKLEPGATARVNQRFNQLDVQFTAQKTAAAATTQPANAATPAPTPRPQRTPAELAGLASPTPAAKPTPDTSRLVKSDPNAAVAGGLVPPTVTSVPTPATIDASPAFPDFTPTPEVTPTAAPTAEQIAQVLPQPAVPVSTTTTSPATGGRTLGATVISRWPWILAALLAVSVALLFVSRRGARRENELPRAAAAGTPPALRDRPATKPLKDTTATARVESAAKIAAVPAVAKAATFVTPAPLAAKEAKPESRAAERPKKQTKAERRREKQAQAAAEKRAATEKKTSAAGPATAAPLIAGAAALIAAKAVAKADAKDDATVDTQPDSTPARADATVASKPEVRFDAKPEATLVKVDVPASAHVPAEEKGIVLGAADAEAAGAEIQKLLAGESYAEAVIAAPDSATRQLVAAELSAALASRNVERHGRARAAFLKHGYFEDAARDLQTAEAPGQRASAALSLALLHDRAATPHLVAALEDPSPDVRRASIEALSQLKDPAACAPLEALRWRERSRQVPQSLIRHAIDACTPAEAEDTLVTDDETLIREPASESAMVETAAVETTAVETVTAEVPAVEIATAEATAVETNIFDPRADEAAKIETAVDETTGVETPADETSMVTEFPLHSPVFQSQPDDAATFQTPVVESADLNLFADESPAVETSSVAEVSFVEAADDEWIEVGEMRADELLEPTAAAPDVPALQETSFDMPAGASASEILPESLDDTAFVYPADSMTEARPASMRAEAAEETAIEIAAEEKGVELAAEVGSVESVRETSVVEWSSAPERASFVEPEIETGAPLELHEAAPLGIALVAEEQPARSRGLAAVDDAEAEQSVRPGQKGLSALGADEDDLSIIPKSIQLKLDSPDATERAESVLALARLNTDEAYRQICEAFDDREQTVRDAAARALYEVADDRAESFTRALREAAPERRRNIGAALSNSGLAEEAISQLTGESREKTYDAFSLLFLMAKAGETAPLIHAIETHSDNEVRLAVVKLLALSGQQDVLPSFRRLAVRGSLPADVRSAVMEAIYQISSSSSAPAAPNRTL